MIIMIIIVIIILQTKSVTWKQMKKYKSGFEPITLERKTSNSTTELKMNSL